MPVEGYPECPDFDRATGLFEIYQQWSDPTSTLHCKDRCVIPCQLKSYSASILKEADITDEAQNSFHIYYPTGQSEVLHFELGKGTEIHFLNCLACVQDLVEVMSYDNTSFIADLGGVLV